MIADVNTEQAKTLSLEKGDKIIINGAVIGHAIEKVDLRAVMETNQGLKAELVGYTSVSNIQPGTIPEITLANMINEDTNLNVDRFITFFKRAGFEAAESERYVGYQLEENWIDDPSPFCTCGAGSFKTRIFSFCSWSSK